MSRISRKDMFMRIAHVVAERGTCNRAYVGALLVINERIVSIGYNGSLPGEPHCDDVGHKLVNGHCIRTVHAEVNCIDFAYGYLHGIKKGNIREATLYITHLPCLDCCNYIKNHNLQEEPNFKITKVIYGKRYPESITELEYKYRLDALEDGGVEVIEQFEV